ncbi:MAG: hypothetical protein JWP87_2754 [Labilithrix sp.]|nr:hypothetical protein [Labilithrix sp.]
MAALAASNLVSLDRLDRLDRLERLDEETLARLGQAGVLQGTNALAPTEGVLSLDWPELERVLPDRGLPRGVIEIASLTDRAGAGAGARAYAKSGTLRGGATTIALSAVRAVHAADARGWCAWITESNAPPLYAPAVAQAQVDLDRLLVVRPSPADLARTVVKVAASGAFDLVVVDAPGGLDGKLSVQPGTKGGRSRVDGSVVIRKLALAAEEKGTTFVVLTNVYTSRAVPWPVALRVEVERRPEAIAVRVTKDRRGRASSQHVVRVAC